MFLRLIILFHTCNCFHIPCVSYFLLTKSSSMRRRFCLYASNDQSSRKIALQLAATASHLLWKQRGYETKTLPPAQWQHLSSEQIIPLGLAASGNIPLSHTIWSQIIKKGDSVIDATCGNGYDSVILSRLALNQSSGILHCIDLQEEAIMSTRKRLETEIGFNLMNRIQFHCRNHKSFPDEIAENSVKAIVYNLGYLPGGNHEITTSASDTVISLENALKLLKRGGLLSIMCYRKHDGGSEETAAVKSYLSSLEEEKWRIFEHTHLNRPVAPILFTVYRII